jgi:hypothetical protein
MSGWKTESQESAMNQPLTRDQQIHLMETAPQRMEERFAAWMRDPRFRAALSSRDERKPKPSRKPRPSGRKAGRA